MTGEQLGVIIGCLNITQKEVADLLCYSEDGVRSWIRRNQQIPEEYLAEINIFVIKRIKEREAKHRDVIDLLVLVSAETDR